MRRGCHRRPSALLPPRLNLFQQIVSGSNSAAPSESSIGCGRVHGQLLLASDGAGGKGRALRSRNTLFGSVAIYASPLALLTTMVRIAGGKTGSLHAGKLSDGA